MKRLMTWLQESAIYVYIVVIVVLIIVSSFFSFRNLQVMERTTALTRETEHITRNTDELLRFLNLMDLGVRGFALTKDQALLDPYRIALRSNPQVFDTLKVMMRKQGLQTENLEKYEQGVKDYVAYCEEMIQLASIDSMAQFAALLKEDRGLGLWRVYTGFSTDLVAHEAMLKEQAASDYKSAVITNNVLQGLLLIFGVPLLYFIFNRIRKQNRRVRSLLMDLEVNNRKYVFDPGTPVSEDAAVIMKASIDNIKSASDFIQKITGGDTAAAWPGMTTSNAALNHENLSGTLLSMRDQMKRIQEEDRKRMWTTEGLTKFTEIIRKYQDDAKTLADHSVRFLSRYMNAQQCAAFILQDDDAENVYLELAASYAFDKKKFVDKKIDTGEGLIGQAFMEGSTVVLTDLPKGYTHITSGLGDATPTCVMIVPMKYNEKTEGVLEIAGFVKWQPHEQEFIERATEYMAASLSSVRSTQKMKLVLQQMQTQTQQLHEQEEEMRQNMEEMMATNEEMRRKESEYTRPK